LFVSRNHSSPLLPFFSPAPLPTPSPPFPPSPHHHLFLTTTPSFVAHIPQVSFLVSILLFLS
ncbi:unnamed protein product, partial [Closterium sp. Naga37s-1]